MKIDFIVVGSGLAGLTSAITLSKFGEVLVLSKRKLLDTATNLAQGGIAAVTLKEDSFESHTEDTLSAGDYHNNRERVEFLVRRAKEAISFLEENEVVFDKNNGLYNLGREGAHSFPRIVHSGDITGHAIEKALVNEVKNNSRILIREEAKASDFIVKNGQCYGVRILENDKVMDVFAKIIVLCTGGLGQLYKWTTNPEVATGDGIAMAHRAGCEVEDLEFIQFHPTALKYGKSPLFLLSEALRGEGAKIVIEKNERFLTKIDYRAELAPRDIVARAIYAEQQKGQEVFLDIRHRGREFIKKRFPNIYREVKKRGFDLVSDLIPVTPAAHYSCGGVAVDLCGCTNIENLFAFGEVACTGVHGANRLASNSLLEAVVFPLQLAEIAMNFPKEISEVETQDTVVKEKGNISEIQNLMWEKVGIIRTKKGLSEANSQLQRMPKTSNMVQVAKLIVRAALNRKESLGAHFVVV